MQKLKTSSMILSLASLAFLLAFQNCGSSQPSGSLYGSGDYDSYGDDNAAPKVNLLDKPSDFSKETTAYFQMSVQVSREGLDYLEYSVDNQAWQRVGTLLNLDSLTAGAHQILFRAKDRNGKMSNEVTHSWVVDPTNPVISFGVSSGIFVHNASGVAAVSIPVTVTDAYSLPTLLQCKVMGISNTSMTPINCSSGDIFNGNLTAGTYRLFTEAQDQAGNTEQKNFVFSVAANSGVLPAPYLSRRPRAAANTRDVVFLVDAVAIAGASLSCHLTDLNDVITNIPCQPGVPLSLNNLPVSTYDGAAQTFRDYKFEAKLVKGARSSSPTSWTWTIDMAAPTITFTKPANGAVLDVNMVSVQFTAQDNSRRALTIECALDGVLLPCVSGSLQTLENLSAGSHSFSVSATDPAGNTSSQMVSWSNPSCDPSGTSFQWPLAGTEGIDWALLSYNDLNGAGGSIRDWNGAVDGHAKAYDNSVGIQMTTGNYTTITSANSFSQVFAADSGVVTAVVNDKPARIFPSGSVALADCRADSTRNGFNYIKIRHSNGLFTRYDFLQAGSIPFAVGASVSKGAFVGRLGASGCQEYPRLRFVTQHCDGTTSIDPLSLHLVGKTYNVLVKMVNTTIYPYSSNEFATTWEAMVKTPPASPIITKTTGVSAVGYLTGAVLGNRLRFELVSTSGCTVRTFSHYNHDGIPIYNNVDRSLLAVDKIKGYVPVKGQVTMDRSTGGIMIVGRSSIPCSGQWKLRVIHVKYPDPAVLHNTDFNPIIAEKYFNVQ